MHFSSLVKAVFFLLMVMVAPVLAEDALPYETLAKNAIMVDVKSGLVYFEKDADTPVPPASMSKLLTQAVAFDYLKSGEFTDEQEFTVSTNAWKKGGAKGGGSTMYANAGSKIRIIDLLHGAIIDSGNDACIALAEGFAGSEAAFVERMRQKAVELGLTSTKVRNVTGLPDKEHVMSVRDLATVARYIAINYPDRLPIYGMREFTWNKITQQNRNPLLVDFPGADGMKTGYTKDAGYGLVGTIQKDGRRLIMVIAGLKSIEDRKDEASKFLRWGLSQFRSFDVYQAGDKVGQARVWGGQSDWVDLVTRDSFRVALSTNEQKTVEMKLNYTGPLLAPVKAGERVGTVRILVEGKAIAELPVLTASAVGATNSMWQKALDSAVIMVFGG